MQSAEELLSVMMARLQFLLNLERRIKTLCESAGLSFPQDVESLSAKTPERNGVGSARITTGQMDRMPPQRAEQARKELAEVGRDWHLMRNWIEWYVPSDYWADSLPSATGGSESQPPRSDELRDSLLGVLCALDCNPEPSAHTSMTERKLLSVVLHTVGERLCSALHQWDSDRMTSARQMIVKLVGDIRAAQDRLPK